MSDQHKGWREVGIALLRGTGGGVIVGMPLLYTMEMWFIGMYISDWHIAGFILLAFAVNLGLNQASGFIAEEHTFWSDLRSSTIALGAGAVITFIVLILVGTIELEKSLPAIVGMVAIGAIPVSIGFSIANTQFAGGGGEPDREKQVAEGEPDAEKRKIKIDLLDVGITAAGAAIFVFAVAPTEEIVMISARTTGLQWAGLIAFSLLLSYAMVFVAEFTGSERRREYIGLLQHPVPETVYSYVFSVGVGLVLLLMLGRTDVFADVSTFVSNSAVVGLPAAIGGAAGRLLV